MCVLAHSESYSAQWPIVGPNGVVIFANPSLVCARKAYIPPICSRPGGELRAAGAGTHQHCGSAAQATWPLRGPWGLGVRAFGICAHLADGFCATENNNGHTLAEARPAYVKALSAGYSATDRQVAECDAAYSPPEALLRAAGRWRRNGILRARGKCSVRHAHAYILRNWPCARRKGGCLAYLVSGLVSAEPRLRNGDLYLYKEKAPQPEFAMQFAPS